MAPMSWHFPGSQAEAIAHYVLATNTLAPSLFPPTLQGLLSPGFHFAAGPASGGHAVFGHIPLDVSAPEEGVAESLVGLRYASARASVGVALRPLTSSVDKAWVLLRHRPDDAPNTHLTFGLQVMPQASVDDIVTGRISAFDVVKADNMSSFFEYQSGNKDSYFSVLVEAVQVRSSVVGGMFINFSVGCHIQKACQTLRNAGSAAYQVRSFIARQPCRSVYS
jgi:hypothetical protein